MTAHIGPDKERRNRNRAGGMVKQPRRGAMGNHMDLGGTPQRRSTKDRNRLSKIRMKF